MGEREVGKEGNGGRGTRKRLRLFIGPLAMRVSFTLWLHQLQVSLRKFYEALSELQSYYSVSGCEEGEGGTWKGGGRAGGRDLEWKGGGCRRKGEVFGVKENVVDTINFLV